MQTPFRRWCIWALWVALMFVGSGQAEALPQGYVVNLPERALLVNANGQILLPDDAYCALLEPGGTPKEQSLWVAATAENAPGYENAFSTYGLLRADGEPITDFLYQSFEYAGDRIIFQRNDRFGLMSLDGAILVDAVYTRLLYNEEGGFLAFRTDPLDDMADTVFYLSADGVETNTGVSACGGMYCFQEGRCATTSAKTRLSGYLNGRGEWVIDPTFLFAGTFSEGRAIATTDRGTGLIDTNGCWLIAPKYRCLYYTSADELILAGDDSLYCFIHPSTGAVIASCDGIDSYFDVLPGRLAFITDGSAVRLLSESGEVMCRIDPCVSLWRQADMDNRIIGMTGEYGTACVNLYDLSGNVIAGPYQSLTALGRMDGEMYYLAARYEVTHVENHRYSLSFWDEIPHTRSWLILDDDGQEIARFEGEYLSCLCDGRVLVEDGDLAFLADFTGNVLARYGVTEESHE